MTCNNSCFGEKHLPMSLCDFYIHQNLCNENKAVKTCFDYEKINNNGEKNE